MSMIPKSKAGRTYTRRIAVAMSLYCVALFAATWALRHGDPGRAAAVALSILPALPIVAVLVIVGLYLREEQDEYQRALLNEALLWAMGGTLAVTSVWGFLETFHQAPHFPALYVFMLFWLFVGLAGLVQRLRFRAASDD